MTTTQSSAVLARRRVFGSVFSPTSLDSYQTRPISPGPDQAAWERAWQLATRFLSVPDAGFTVAQYTHADDPKFLQVSNRHQKSSSETSHALRSLVRALERGDDTPRNILDWYGYEIRRHFLKNFRNGLYEVGWILTPELLTHELM